MPTLSTTAGDIYYTDHRKADSPYTPVVLVHGAGGTHLDWPPELRRLPQANAIAIDLPGHGKSAPPGRQSVGAYAEAIVAFLDALELDRMIIAGHSMGGAITQMLALEHADRVAGLILVGTGARLRVHPNILEQILVDQKGVADLLSDWIWGSDAPAVLRERASQQLMATPATVTHGDYLACNQFDVMPRLPEITAPTLVISGTADRMTPHKYSVYLSENIPDAELLTVPDAGHMVALEKPQIVVERIAAWLDRLHEEHA